MKRKHDKHSEIFNNFINEVNNTSQQPKKIKSDKNNNKINKYDYSENETKEDIESKRDKELENQIKLIKLENDLLMDKIREKENILRNYKKKCMKQKSKIDELKYKIKELNEKEKNNSIKKENNINHNDAFEESLALKAVEQQILDEIKKNASKLKYSDDSYNNNINNDYLLILDNIKTVKFNIYNSTFYQCGICMDSFKHDENIKQLACDHIFHKECLNQWLQSKKNCPLCEKIIY